MSLLATRIQTFLLAAAVTGGTEPTAARAHGDLRATAPEDGARLKQPPKEVRVSVTEAPTEGAVALGTLSFVVRKAS